MTEYQPDFVLWGAMFTAGLGHGYLWGIWTAVLRRAMLRVIDCLRGD